MRARVLLLSALGSAAVLLVGWEAGTAAGPGSPTIASGRSAPDSAPPTAAPSAPAPSSSAASSAPARPAGTFAGRTATTPYGPVQVAVVVQNGHIVDVKALKLTDQGGRSVAISASAAPVLRVEALKAQSARIDAVSGATYTSDGYRTSLQSAIDAAGL
jgi:uncharacterized protein with FMN-binding domain